MERWEYLSKFIKSEAKFPRDEQGKRVEIYNPMTLALELNTLGLEGWELISAVPYAIGSNDDILTHRTSPNQSTWSHTYLCIFKRRLPDQS